MAEARVERRLAAILAADVVGYSRLMEADEAGTLVALTRHRETIFDPAVAAHNGRRHSASGLLIALAVLIAGLLFAFTVGRFPVSIGELLNVAAAELTGRSPDVSAAVQNVILQVRGPRVVVATLIGAALAVAGTAFQGLFRNPLVSPDLLGASSGAALGSVIGIYLSLGVFAIQAFAFVGGLIAVCAVYLIGSSVRTRDPILVLVLTGVVIGTLLGSGIGLVKYVADPYNQLPATTFWLLGSLAATNNEDLERLSGPIALGILVLIALRWRMNVMSLPDEEARALGLPSDPLRIVIVAAATLITSASVATAGIIGWVGLVVPHMARALVGPDFARLLFAATLLGGAFLLVIDTLARSVTAIEIPLGILTALVGTPFFIWLLASVSKTWS
jgi:iron complex transport system permease protein